MEPARTNHSSLGLRLRTHPIQFINESPIVAPRDQQISLPIHTTEFMNSSIKEEAGLLEARLIEMSKENRRLNETLSTLSMKYDALRNQLLDLVSASPFSGNKGSIESLTRKRKSLSLEPTLNYDINALVGKSEGFVNRVESVSIDDYSFKRLREDAGSANTSKIYVRTDPSEKSLMGNNGGNIVKRSLGTIHRRELTTDAPLPLHAPLKKKVQRSAGDGSLLVATYEGEHNHPSPSPSDPQGERPTGLIQCGSVPINSPVPRNTLDLPQSGIAGKSCWQEMNSQLFQELIAEQVSSTLTQDPSFTADVATAISARFHQPTC